MISLDENLWVSQERLRKMCQIDSMVAHVKSGGFWTREALDKWAAANKLMPKFCPTCSNYRIPGRS